MNFLISIEKTAECPYSFYNGGIIQTGCYRISKGFYQYGSCVGLGQKGCPLVEDNCGNCEYLSTCSQFVESNGFTNDIGNIDFCSAHKKVK